MTRTTDTEDTSHYVRLTVTITVVRDDTLDMPALLSDIDGERGVLIVAGYDFDAKVEVVQ